MVVMTRTCASCKTTKELDCFYDSPTFPLGKAYRCIPCHNADGLRRYRKNKESICDKRRAKHRELRLEVLKGFGGECECCGEKQWQFLAIDHRNGGGSKERRESVNRNHSTFYRKLIAENFPKEKFRILCSNCNTSMGLYGSCPHASLL